MDVMAWGIDSELTKGCEEPRYNCEPPLSLHLREGQSKEGCGASKQKIEETNWKAIS
jgi:hypothetical protein